MYSVMQQTADRASKLYRNRICACVCQKWER